VNPAEREEGGEIGKPSKKGKGRCCENEKVFNKQTGYQKSRGDDRQQGEAAWGHLGGKGKKENEYRRKALGAKTRGKGRETKSLEAGWEERVGKGNKRNGGRKRGEEKGSAQDRALKRHGKNFNS